MPDSDSKPFPDDPRTDSRSRPTVPPAIMGRHTPSGLHASRTTPRSPSASPGVHGDDGRAVDHAGMVGLEAPATGAVEGLHFVYGSNSFRRSRTATLDKRSGSVGLMPFGNSPTPAQD